MPDIMHWHGNVYNFWIAIPLAKNYKFINISTIPCPVHGHYRPGSYLNSWPRSV